MNILIDARAVRRRHSGIGVYTESMTHALDSMSEGHDISALTLEPGAWLQPLRNVTLWPAPVDFECHPRAEFYENVGLPRLLHELETDLLWGPAFLIPWVRTKARKVVTIHDLTVFSHPECYPRHFAAYMRWVIRLSVRAADLVIADSDAVRAAISEEFGRSGKRVETVHAAPDAIFCPADPAAPAADRAHVPAVLAKLEAEGLPYVLAIGSGDPRKNTEFTERVMRRVRTAGDTPTALVVLGRAETAGREDLTVRLGWLDQPALREVYRRARMFLFPSLHEGFGMPALEAMACGCPVVTSRAGSLPEVCGDAAAYIDQADEFEAAERITRLLQSPEELARLRQAGLAQAARFSWKQSAEKLLRLFQEIV